MNRLMMFYVEFEKTLFLCALLCLGAFSFCFSQNLSVSTEVKSDSLLALIEGESNDSVVMEYYNQLRRITTFEWPEQALVYNREFGRRAKKLQLKSKYGVSKAYDATILLPLGRYAEALESLLISESIFDSLDNQAALGSIYNSIGAVYERMERDSLARIFYQKSFDIAKDRDDLARQAIALTNLSELHYHAGEYAKSKELMEKVLASTDVLHADYLPRYQLIYAKTLLALTEYSTAEDIYRNILADTSGLNAFIKVETFLGLGKLKNRTQKYGEAERWLNQALSIVRPQGFKEVERDIHEQLALAYESGQKYSSAIYHLRQFQDLKDSLLSEESDKNLISALTEFEAEKKEQEIQLLQSQNEIKDLKIKRNYREKTFLISGVVGLVLLIGLGVRLFYVQRKGNRLLREKNAIISKNLEEKNMLLKEIHHRVKNNLQVISSLLKLQSQFIKDKSAIKAIAEGRNRVNSMAILHQNLYSYDDVRGVDMKKYFANLIKGLFDAYNIESDRIKLHTDIDSMTLDVDTVIPLGLIANELVTNALKHAFAETENAELEVNLWESNKTLFFKVKDNGMGYEPSSSISDTPGFGKKLIQVLSTKLQAEVEYVKNSGTEVILKVMDYKKVA